MSTLQVKVVRLEVLSHPQADRLEIARVGGEGGFTAVVSKGQFKNNDLAIFVPENSVVPEPIQEFLATSQKITVVGGRIRCTKIRGVFSDGLCLAPDKWLPADKIKEDEDVTALLGITKYEPPFNGGNNFKSAFTGKGINHNYQNSNFKKYTDIENLKKYPRSLENASEVIVTKKMHGTNFRCGYVKRPNSSLSLVEKVKRFFGFNTEVFEFLVGSHNTIRMKKDQKASDVYWKAANKYGLQSLTKELNEVYQNSVVIFGEIIGPGIQKGYDYGIPKEDIELRVFDIMIGDKYLDWDVLQSMCGVHRLPMVETVYRGKWNKDLVKLSDAIDEYNGKKFVREGVVIRPVIEGRDSRVGRTIFKYISEAFRLDKTNSDFH